MRCKIFTVINRKISLAWNFIQLNKSFLELAGSWIVETIKKLAIPNVGEETHNIVWDDKIPTMWDILGTVVHQ